MGAHLGKLLEAGDVVWLAGDLGAGKTTLSAGIGQGWGTPDPLTSPSFVIIHQHERPRDKTRLYHIDAYRLPHPEAADSLGLDDILEAEHVVLIEWAERISTWLPPHYLKVSMTMHPDDERYRQLIFEATGQRYQELLEALRKAIFGV
ncbi:MAG: tRNA (adenosine(37)-N6)-threonylcarbamoyltransferase complex ATPase subunit type 1 TsaE [Anaerolineae bacterium]|nr:tRNA (adenosine(37)-N6)-threonylcarbamoyltransferase complex ATPase subunit type 1 TsaE [Anaerolineae bacterium]